jgi:hypothetical protein
MLDHDLHDLAGTIGMKGKSQYGQDHKGATRRSCRRARLATVEQASAGRYLGRRKGWRELATEGQGIVAIEAFAHPRTRLLGQNVEIRISPLAETEKVDGQYFATDSEK